MHRIFLIICCACFALGCATSGASRGGPRKSGWYAVRKGDTIGNIAHKSGSSVQVIAEWNNIQDPNLITQGKRLYIPSAAQARGKGKRAPKSTKEIKTFHGKFAWPIEGPVHSLYGIRRSRRHDGIDIGAKRGAPIKAAASGTVAFEGRLSGYGKLIIIRHPDDYYTAYAHNSRHLVKKGQKIKKGKVIAKVGTTGRSSGPHLHFEIRRRQTARNPLFFLRPRNANERRVHKLAQRQQQAPAKQPAGKVAQKAKRKSGSTNTKTITKTSSKKWQKYEAPDKNKVVKINKGYRKKHRKS